MTPLDHGILRASAGTGKTFALSNRFLSLLFLGASPETILATTFTRKAAGEVLDRVLLRLARAAASDLGATELREALNLKQITVDRGRCLALLTQVCRSLHRLSIATLDSFMARMARSFRHELGLPSNPRMVGQDDPKVLRLRMQAIEAVLAEDEPTVLVDLLRRLHHDTAQRSVSQALDTMVAELYEVYRAAPNPAQWNQLPVPAGIREEAVVTFMIDRLAQLGDCLPCTQSGEPNKVWAKAWSEAVHAAQVRDWPKFSSLGLVQAAVKDPPRFSNIPIPDDWLAVVEPLAAHARAHQLQYLMRQTQATFELLRRFDRHYTQLRLQQQVMLFADLPQVLARELPRVEHLQTELYYRLDARVQHLLLDEFQDTSLDQWRVLQPLAHEVCSVGDGSRSFFCVGDLKQAIYAWRGGCAELFDKVATDLHLWDPQHQASLTRSYRSSPVILETIDQIFTGLGDNPALEKVCTLARSWQRRYEVHQAAKQLPGYVELVTSKLDAKDTSELDSTDRSDGGFGQTNVQEEDVEPLTDTHRRYVAQRVQELYEKLGGRSVGILVRSNKVIRPLLFALGELGVPASGEGGNTLTDDPAVNAILAAFTLADHPGDQVAAFHLAHCPLGEILGLHTHQGPQVERVSAVLRRTLLTQGYARTLTDWARQLAPASNPRSVQRMSQLVELADDFEPDVSLRPSRFVEFVRQSPVQEPAPAAVRVMTIHKSKGLEFDQVVLPELHHDLARMPAQGVYVLRAGPTEPVTAVFRGTNQQTRELSPQLQEAYEQEYARRMHDHFCALYVAMTRARHGLLMIVPPLELTPSGKPSNKGWSNMSYAAILRQALSNKKQDESLSGGDVLYAYGNPQWMGAGESRTEATGPTEQVFCSTPSGPSLEPATSQEVLRQPRLVTYRSSCRD